MRLLEGAVVDVETSDGSDDLLDEVRELRDQLRESRRETALAKRDAAHALAALRKQLSPLYQALRMVFGELDAAGVDEPPAASGAVNARTSAVWESWKSKLPGRTAQIIDALLLHGEMNSTQLAIAIGIHRNNVPPLIFKLNKAGLIDKKGTKYSLKKLG